MFWLRRDISFLLSRFVDGLVAGIGVFVDLAVSNTPETARAGQPERKPPMPANISKYRISHIISFLQRTQKAENIFVDAPGLRRCTVFFGSAVLQFLSDRLTNCVQQFLLTFILTDHAADSGGALYLPGSPSASSTPAAGWVRAWRRTDSSAFCYCSCFLDSSRRQPLIALGV